jgi:RNA polymerase sigma-70 factor, ECF subfamily
MARSPVPAQGPESLQRSDIEALIATHYVGLRLLLARRAGDEEVARDLLNDAICTTWEKWQAGKIEHPDQIAGFIFQVAMNHLRNHRRSMAERPDKRAPDDALEMIESPEAAADEGIQDHIAARVKELIQSMSSRRDRTVLVRFYLDEADRETICRELRLTAAQFARILYRARARLKELLESAGLKRSDLFSLFAIF